MTARAGDGLDGAMGTTKAGRVVELGSINTRLIAENSARLQELIAILTELFPACFVAETWRPHKPLKVGIHKDLVELGLLSPRECSIALRRYASRLMYRRAVARGGPRFDLDGHVAGEVRPDEADHAKAAVAAIEAKRAPKAKAVADEKRAKRANDRHAQRPADKRYHEAQPEKTYLRPPEPPREPQPLRLGLADLRAAARARREAHNPSRKSIMDNLTSGIVPGFKRVSVAPGLSCSSCGAPFSPHAARFDGSTVTLRCDNCHTDALICWPCLPNGNDE
jgi:sRNA-binding protein